MFLSIYKRTKEQYNVFVNDAVIMKSDECAGWRQTPIIIWIRKADEPF